MGRQPASGVLFFQRLTPLIIFATKSLGFSEPSPSFEGIVGTEEDLDFEKIWSRNRYVAAAATPTPTTIASVDTFGIISGEKIKSKRRERKRLKMRGGKGMYGCRVCQPSNARRGGGQGYLFENQEIVRSVGLTFQLYKLRVSLIWNDTFVYCV